MSRNLAVKIRIEMVECEEPVSGQAAGPQELGNGEFQLVLDGDKSLDIDALETCLLSISFPAMRQALGDHLSSVLKNGVRNASLARIGIGDAP
jgi:hypothetical protein